MGGVPRSNDLGSRLVRLERAVGNLQRQSTLSSASISEGNLTVRRGGSIRVIDGGSIIGEGEGVLDWEGDAHFGGNLTAEGDTYLGGVVTYGPGNRPSVVDADAVQETGWQATNNGTIASLSIPWAANRSTAVVMAQANGFYQADFNVPRSDLPAFEIIINGTVSPPIARTPDNFDTYWLVGAFNRKFTGSGSVNVSVRTRTGNQLSPGYPDNRIYLGATAVFIE